MTDAEKKESLLLNKKRRKLILHNKAPMWNEASQVCIFYPLIVEIIRIAGFLNKYLKNSKLRHFQSFCEKSGIETKSVIKGIHLLWSITKDEEILKYQTLELSNVLNVLQET